MSVQTWSLLRGEPTTVLNYSYEKGPCIKRCSCFEAGPGFFQKQHNHCLTASTTLKMGCMRDSIRRREARSTSAPPKPVSVSHIHSLPSSSLPQGQNGNFPPTPLTPVCSLPMANDQGNNVGVSRRPRAGSVGHFIFTHVLCSHPSNIT